MARPDVKILKYEHPISRHSCTDYVPALHKLSVSLIKLLSPDCLCGCCRLMHCVDTIHSQYIFARKLFLTSYGQ